MINEDYCSFEVAKLLKEKGFDEICSYEWGVPDIDKGYVLQKWAIYNGQIKNSELIEDAYAAPTHQMAMAWLREEKNIIVNVWYNGVDYATEYFEPDTQTEVGKFVFIGDGYYAYEEAVEEALKYCLENLI